jgi:endonuclease/exonuclease/phosphatase family metal-dependent hydrolase
MIKISTSKELDFMNLNVISFNLRYRDDANENSIAQRAQRLNIILPRYDADILCMQEISKTWQPHLENDYREQYDMYLQYRNETTDIEAIAILWKKDRFDCLDRGCFWLSDTPEVESRGWDELYNCFRICNYVILREKTSSKTFVVMNTHFGFGDNGQIKSCELIYSYSQKISNLPTLVLGDFNMQPSSPAYDTMIRHFRDVNNCISNDMRPTWHGYEPEVITSAHIDYCFIDNRIVPVKRVLITDTVNGKFPSDHFGLYCTLEV